MEMAYQIYWHSHIKRHHTFTLVDGRKLKILNPGLLNTNAGPDFFNASIEIDGQRWNGNVEIHEKASMWFSHKHHLDPAYNSVVLHAVVHADTQIEINGRPLPTLLLPVTEKYLHSYQDLRSPAPLPKCAEILKTLSSIFIADWLDANLLERLNSKEADILTILNQSNGDWHTTFFITIARALGFGINSHPFEILARSLPLNFARRHSDNLMQLEAMLLGQAGFLISPSDRHIKLQFNNQTDTESRDHYNYLCREYNFLAKKYSLCPPPGCHFKMARTRPANFPHRRISMLARLCSDIDHTLSLTLEALGNEQTLRKIYSLQPTKFWQTHYSFNTPKIESTVDNSDKGFLSPASQDLIFINAVAPFYYAYGHYFNKTNLADAAIDLLHNLNPENNNIIRNWKYAGINPDCAAHTQALYHLYRNKCNQNLCHLCRWGQKLL